MINILASGSDQESLSRQAAGELRSRVRKEMGRRGFSIARHIPFQLQSQLLESIKPLRTEHPLIRIGGPGDGGYLVPDDLEAISACFSPGVDVVATFEAEMILRGVPCFQADGSIDRPPLEHPLIDFDRKFLGITNLDPSGLKMTLDSWVAQKMPHSGDLILQMDIEGEEWAVLSAASDETLGRFRIIVLEAHDMDRIVEHLGHQLIGGVFRKLLLQFDVVHVHPNNWDPFILRTREYSIPRVLEYTFHRKDRIKDRHLAEQFPHPLDYDCATELPSIKLPRCLYGQA